ncbi:lmo0937 family membrane protein [Prosthecobacter sp.]|uniref:lmo0937 family membrane protein n=1 Tax=Prosthecobacter sp. TaxID=1965333 RepID=UPI0037842540
MYYTIAFVLLILWLASWLSLHILGAFVHLLLVLAIIVLVMGLFRKPSQPS